MHRRYPEYRGEERKEKDLCIDKGSKQISREYNPPSYREDIEL